MSKGIKQIHALPERAVPTNSMRHTRSLTYPQARLYLGILSVGSMVVAASVGLHTGAGDWFSGLSTGSFAEDAGALALFLGCYVVFSLPFDFTGGFLLPGARNHASGSLLAFTLLLLRSALTQATLLLGCSLLLLAALRWGGWTAAITTAALVNCVLANAQTTLARMIGNVRSDPDGVTLLRGRVISSVASDDGAFGGGIAGLPGFERIVVPKRWSRDWSAARFHMAVQRRVGAIELGMHRRGLFVGVGWNLIGLIMTAAWIGPPTGAVGEIVTVSLIMTLWSLVGILFLPTASRNAVKELDRYLLTRGYRPDKIAELAEASTRLQDGESARHPWIETVFHPIPSLKRRTAGLRQSPPSFAAWNASRLMLFHSWASIGLLSRAVHGNVGRPDLWVLAPAD